MRTIAHISDLHFGRIDSPVAEALAADLQQRDPSLLVISGDFTQRARPEQYQQAAAFVERLPTPRLVVPGNHDIPLWNAFMRVARPLSRYRRYISDDLSPEFRDEELIAIGINSARSLTRTSGWLSRSQLQDVRRRLAKVPQNIFKVVVTHHPFIAAPNEPHGDILRRAGKALEVMEAAGVDLLLAGHLHHAFHEDVRMHYGMARRSILSIQAGTSTSTRRRGEPNAWNWITLSPDLVTVAVHTWNGSAFVEARVTRFKREENAWITQT